MSEKKTEIILYELSVPGIIQVICQDCLIELKDQVIVELQGEKNENTKYPIGAIVTYHEMGEVSTVKVIADNSDEKTVDLELEIIEVIQESAVCVKSEPGERFKAFANRKYGQQGWFINEEPEEFILNQEEEHT